MSFPQNCNRAAFERTKDALTRASRIAVMSGAGISAESGVPTFRGAGGLWRNYSPHELATPQAFRRDPQLVWEWYDWRRGLIGECAPNAAHHVLAQLEGRSAEFTVITQNVDGLHSLAGSESLLEIHGDIWTLRCTECGTSRVDRTHPLPLLPYCATCGGLERPGVVWFGESLDQSVLERAAEAATRAEVLLVIGTSGLVQPAASLAYLTKDNGGFVAVINTEETPHSDDMDAMLLGRAGEVVPALCEKG